MDRSTDSELAARLMVREEAALREVIGMYSGAVHGMARRVITDATMAEEVAQDTFLALWRRPGAFDPARGNLRSFLLGVARNKAIDLVRREESLKRTKDSLAAELHGVPSSSTFDAALSERDEVVSALAQLTDMQREAVVLAYYGGRTYREVAGELGIPEGTAKTRLRDGLGRLKTLLERSNAKDA